MIKVVYGLPKSELNSRYLQLFDIGPMNYEWQQIRGRIANQYSVVKIPLAISEILTADYPKLVDIFQTYIGWKRLPKVRKKEIEALFDYKKYQPKIAAFMEPKNRFQLHVCHYCGMAYINAYGISNDYKDKYQFVKNASPQELRKFIPGNLSDKTIKKILDNRDNFTCLDDFGIVQERAILSNCTRITTLIWTTNWTRGVAHCWLCRFIILYPVVRYATRN